MAFCAQVEEIGVGGGCESILVGKLFTHHTVKKS